MSRRRTQVATLAAGGDGADLHMDTLECSTERVEELDESLTVLNYDGRKWLIGVQVAAALNRETFNMYRSMKVKGVDLTRAAPAHVEWLIRQGVVKGGTHSVTLIPYDTGLSFINSVVSAGIVTTPSPSSRKAKKPSSGGIDGLTTTTTDSGTKRARDSVNTLLQQLTPTSERLAANAATKKLRAVGGDAALSFLEEEDSDDFSDDVVQPSKRRRASAATRRDPSGSSINKRPSPRRSRTTESPLAARSPSYNLSALPRLQTSFANARFMPTQATIPTLPDAHDEDRPSRRARRWPSTSTVTRKEASLPEVSGVPRGPRHINRRKLPSWQVVRAIQPEDCVPFKFRKRPAAAAPQGMDVVGAGGLLDEEPGLAATLLHSLMRAIA